MEFGPVSPDGALYVGVEGARIAALIHHHRNQIQTMASLVGLLGRRSPQGERREAFEDLRARIEGLTFVPFDGSDEPVAALDFAVLVGRVASTIDPEGRHAIVSTADIFDVSPGHGGLIAQLLTELVIDLQRSGLGDGRGGTAEVLIERRDGEVRLAGRLTGKSAPANRETVRDFGRTLADSLVQGLGGTVARETPDGFWFDAVIPSPQGRR